MEQLVNAFMKGNLACVERTLERASAKIEEAQLTNLSNVSLCVRETQASIRMALDDLRRAVEIEEMTEGHEHG